MNKNPPPVFDLLAAAISGRRANSEIPCMTEKKLSTGRLTVLIRQFYLGDRNGFNQRPLCTLSRPANGTAKFLSGTLAVALQQRKEESLSLVTNYYLRKLAPRSFVLYLN